MGLLKLLGTGLVSVLPFAPSAPAHQVALVRPAQPPAASQALQMSVEIDQGVTSLPVATSGPGVVLNDQGQILQTLPAGKAVYARPGDEGGISLGSWQGPASVWLVPQGQGFVYAGRHWYRGRLRLIREGNGILVVNQVPLEEYLFSVVGCEMPAYWSLEALKAQAVAARSYAVAHYVRPASQFYQLGNDQAWQVYRGLDGETPRTQAAVLATTGQILSYRGGIVISLYASTDQVVLQAHDGLGMSQTGAEALAAKGYNYQQILGDYYPGASLAELELAAR